MRIEQHTVSGNVAFANTLRGLAALCVVFSHHFGVFWTNPAAVAALLRVPAFNTSAPVWFTAAQGRDPFNWGALGVAVFFLISGFVMPFSLRKTSAAGFAIGRCFRIFPVYVAGFSLSLLAMAWAMASTNQTLPYTPLDVITHYIPGIRDLAGTANIDGIIWTLEIEMKFYFVCFIVLPLFRAPSFRLWLVPAAVFLVGAAICGVVVITGGRWLPFQAGLVRSAQYIDYMFIGVVLHYVHEGLLSRATAAFLIGMLGVMFVMLWMMGPYPESVLYAWNYLIAFGVFILAMAMPRRFKGTRSTNFLADISYPLYVTHAVIGYVLLKGLTEAGTTWWLAILGTGFASLSIAWVLHISVEIPCQRLGKKISATLMRGATVVPLPAAIDR